MIDADGKPDELRRTDDWPAPLNADLSPDAQADIAFADSLERHSRKNFVYVSKIGFFVWDERRYRADETATVMAYAEWTVSKIAQAASREPNPIRRDWLNKLATRYSHAPAVRGALEFWKPRIAVRPDDLDKDRYLLNVRNGTVDLRTGDLRQHNREHRITKVVPVEYQAHAKSPRWYQFLGEVFGGDIQLAEYLKRLVGYSLTGDQREHVLAFLWGNGSNGKSILVSILMAIGGDYAQAAPTSLLMKKYSDAVPTDVARLRGARIVIASESPEGGHLDEERIKLLSGGDRISARFMRQDLFEFDPTHHLFLQTNHKPHVSGTSHAIWRRIRLIPFGVRFEDPSEVPDTAHPKDTRLQEKLHAELPGILAWAVEGAREWFEKGLGDPETVKAATKAYRREEDILTDFVESRCDVGAELSASVGDLYDTYKGWAEAEGNRPWTKNRFSRRLTDAGFESERGLARNKIGIALKDFKGASL
jgi:putative DNA primase/helicase